MSKIQVSLNREESSAIKGLLIFLIVLGHNAVFTDSVKGIWGFLYTFHVQAFFILPFLYGSEKNYNFTSSLKKNFWRLYWPFVIFFISLSVLWYGVQNVITDSRSVFNVNLIGWDKFKYYVVALFSGSYYLIDYFTGFQYLWFLPVMFSMSVLREVIPSSRLWQSLIMVIGLISYTIFFVFMYKQPYEKDVNSTLMLFSPFAILQGCGAYFLGKLGAQTLNHKYRKSTVPVFSTLFIVASIMYLVLVKTDSLTNTMQWGFRFIMPFLFVSFLILLKTVLAKSKFLRALGNYSFPIYIIHPIICTVAFMVCDKCLEVNLVSAIIVQVVVVGLAYWISVLVYKIEPIRKKLFPKTFDEIYKKKQ